MSSKYPPSWHPLPDTPPIEISAWNFQGMFLRLKEHHSWHQEWPSHPCLWSETLNVIQVHPFLTPLPDTLLIVISTQNFQGIFLGIKEHQKWHWEWPYHPCIWSGTPNVLQVPPFLTPPTWHTSNWDISTKFSWYLPRGKKTSFVMSGMIMSSMSPVRNPQCPPSTPLLDPPFLTHFQLWYQHKMFRVSSLEST